MSKRLMVLAIAALLCALARPAMADDASDLNCNVKPEVSYVIEDHAQTETQADDYVSAYIDFQRGVEIRGECADATRGQTHLYHLFYESMDLVGQSLAASQTQIYANDASGLWDSARNVMHDLRGHVLTGDLKTLADKLQGLLSQPAPQAAPADDGSNDGGSL